MVAIESGSRTSFGNLCLRPGKGTKTPGRTGSERAGKFLYSRSGLASQPRLPRWWNHTAPYDLRGFGSQRPRLDRRIDNCATLRSRLDLAPPVRSGVDSVCVRVDARQRRTPQEIGRSWICPL